MSDSGIDELEAILCQVLDEYPAGLREFDLIKRLQALDDDGLPGFSLADDLALYRTHFLVFHALYRLRDRLWRERRGHLEIGVLRIALEPYRSGEEALTTQDPLRAFYLDLANLENTTADDVRALLDGFWRGFRNHGRRREALAELGLAESADRATVKRRYRALAMRHHPDRGGDAERFKAIHAAMRVLDPDR